VLFDLGDYIDGLRNIKALGRNPQGVIDGRKLIALKRRHHDRACDFHHFADSLLSHENSSVLIGRSGDRVKNGSVLPIYRSTPSDF
jgi:hypothetical protein